MSRRFTSLSYAPAEARSRLRDRLGRFLPARGHADVIRRHGPPKLHDEALLELLLHLDIAFGSDEKAARSAYEAALPENSTERDFDTLINDGWLRVIWGRISTSFEVSRAAQTVQAGALSALNALLKGRFEERCHVADEASKNPDLVPVVESINREGTKPHTIGCEWPEWIAARLWDRAAKDPADLNAALRLWVDRWHVLGFPSLIPSAAWSEGELLAFWKAATELLGSKAGLLGWEELRASLIARMALTSGQSSANLSNYLPAIPDTLIERSLWLENYNVQRPVMDIFQECQDVFAVAGLLITDIEKADHSPAPNPRAAELFALATERPELFLVLLFRLRTTPALLADVLLNPATSALGCLIIGEWQFLGGAWDRQLTNRDDEATKAMAFADAASVMGWFLQQGSLPPAEAAALLKWIHRKAGPGFIEDQAGTEPMLPMIRAELVGQSPKTLRAMVAALTAAMPASGLGTSDFAAVLDLSDLGGIEDEVDADTIVAAYAHSIATGDYSLSAHRIGVSGAAALARTAGRTQALRTQFLYPLDVRARLAAATPQDNEFIIADAIGRSLRTHIRILCRAIIGTAADAPADLFDALVAAVRTGALKHKEKGRVAAFAPRFEKRIAAPVSDRPLAADLAAALTFVDRQRQEALLAAILETDEPLILAQLLSRSPPNLRSDIERRIAALAPKDAAAIQSLPEMQARIDELLTAGAADAAASYMAAEVGLTTWGKPAGRELTRFQNQLRLHFLREDWAAIAATADPNFREPLEQATAVETLRQFRGLAALKGPNPNPEWAKMLFAELFAKRPSPSFANNWFAAEISELLQTDSFSRLKGDQIRKGQKAIAEIERMTALLPAASADEAMECNRALLLLALGEPSQALAVLSAVTFIRLQDTAAAYRAIALARLGRRSEATAALDAAEHTCGRTRVLAAARSHIASGAPFLSLPDVSVYDDLVENVASAIARFRTMNPADQARVLQRHADPFEALLVDYVRAAADAVVSLVPKMKGVQIDAIEDDLTSFIQHMLAARVQFLGWSVGDQSKGGFSAKGNAGERDLLITWGSSVLALIEAVICDRPLTQDVMKADLESHFQKLLGYGNPRVFFHLTYAYIEDKQGLMLSLETSAEMASPAGFTYLGREQIPHEDSRPPGFVARYSADFGDVKVVFLVLNLGQQRQRQAAKTAAATKARKASKKPKSIGVN